jgi:hypothetical protein
MSQSKKTSKPNIKIYFKDFYRVCINAIKTTGINLMPDEDWSATHPDLVAKFFRYYNIVFLINGILLLISFVGNIFTFLDNTNNFLEAITTFLSSFGNFFKAYLMYRYQEVFRNIIRILKKLFPSFPHEQELHGIPKTYQSFRRIERIYGMFYVSILLGVFMPTVISIFQSEMIWLNWTPYEINSMTRYVATFFWLFLTSLIFCLNGFGSDFVLFSTITLLGIQFKVNSKKIQLFII